MGDFAKFYQDGGGFMHAIALCAVLGAGVMIERFIFLFFRFNINGGQFFNQTQKLVMANIIDRASNRVTFGLIAGSLIVGSRLLVSSDSGAAKLGIVGYSIAGFLGIALLISILRSRNF